MSDYPPEIRVLHALVIRRAREFRNAHAAKERAFDAYQGVTDWRARKSAAYDYEKSSDALDRAREELFEAIYQLEREEKP